MCLQDFEQAGTAQMMEKAAKLGFSFDSPDWVNFGQGAPELGFIQGDLDRLESLVLKNSFGYTPVPGLPILRQKIADYYNFSRSLTNSFNSSFDKISNSTQPHQKAFSKENVNISSGGGRGALLKIFASLKKGSKIGYLNPDYTAYKGIFQIFSDLKYFPINLDSENGFKIDLNLIKAAIKKHSLDIIFFSNPSNPTGQVLTSLELIQLLQFCKQENCLLIHDEFYSKFVYNSKTYIFSALNYISDIEKENLIILDGLTKGWRYPGFRLSWIISNSKNIQKINNLSSVLDGGCSHPIQKLALQLFDTSKLISQSLALQDNFNQKREYLLQNLLKLGFKINSEPYGAFYIFAGIHNFKNRFLDDLDFSQKLLTQKLITIPGRFFNLNLEQEKSLDINNFVRFSYGLEMSKIKQGIKILEKYL
jgi:aspartate/methionine/tyrosine aminotransferase